MRYLFVRTRVFQRSPLLTFWRGLHCLELILLTAAVCLGQSTPVFKVTTVAGNGTSGYSGDGGPATTAEFAGPSSVAAASGGTLYIADQFNHRIRMVAGGNISTVAGNGTGGYSGDGGAATKAELDDPSGVAVDTAGNLYIADTNNNVIRKVTKSGTISTIAGNQAVGSGYTGDGGAGTNAQLFHPSSVAVDAAGNVYIADTGNNVIRLLATGGTITTFAGNTAAGYDGDGGPATSAQIQNPTGLTLDAAGNLYIADSGNNVIRMVTPAGIISTVAGSVGQGFSGDGGPAIAAKLDQPSGVAVDAGGNLYFSDRFSNRIRWVSPSGIIGTVAGSGVFGAAGGGGPALQAEFYFPSGVALDPSGNVYVADGGNNEIRQLTPVAQLPSIKANGVLSLYGALPAVAPGSWIEIDGSYLAGTTRVWSAADFNGPNAPTSLSGTTVSIGGQAAFVEYVSAGQINAQVPSGVGTGQQQLTVTTAVGTSSPYTITVNTTAPGLYAPAQFNIGGIQYVGALVSDGVNFDLPPGAVAGVFSRQAYPGETITLYGVGFGEVTPSVPAGQIVPQSNTLTASLQIFFGQSQAALTYLGLVPGTIGLYQFNVVVPNVANSDAVPLTFTLGGVSGSQTLYTAVHN